MSNSDLISALAAAALAAEWHAAGLDAALAPLLPGIAPRRRQRLVSGILTLDRRYPPSQRWLEFALFSSPAATVMVRELTLRGVAPPVVLDPPRFNPAPPFAGLDIPRLATPNDLAAWLGLDTVGLDWFADARAEKAGRSRHYRSLFVAKKQGPPRLIEAPLTDMKAIQRRILREILTPVPPHDAAHGFVPGRNCLSGARRHAGEAVVAGFDLRDFFTRTPLGRVGGLFRSLGYPWAVARYLTLLASTATPRTVFDTVTGPRHDRQTVDAFAGRHLPQGAPTSPALANLVAWRLDLRLAGLARRLGGAYSRYVDDLAFSGDEAFAARLAALQAGVATIVADEGHALQPAKTRIMRRHARQIVTGLVVNQHLSPGRAEIDRLKATLHNCVRSGWQSQNRTGRADFRSHLDGRVGWVEQVHPARGMALREVFDRIDWTAPAA